MTLLVTGFEPFGGRRRIRLTGVTRMENPLPIANWAKAARRQLGHSHPEIFLSDYAGDYLCNFSYYQVLTEWPALRPCFYMWVPIVSENCAHCELAMNAVLNLWQSA